MLSEKLVEDMKQLCNRESETLWEQGDRLVGEALSDDELAKLAQVVQRRAMTLRERERVSREFPAAVRDHRHAWTVYRILSRIPDPRERQAILDARAEWTVEAMEIQVREWVRKQTGVEPKAQEHRTRGGMRLGNVRVTGQLQQNGRIKLTIEAPVADLQTFDTGDEVVISGTVG